MTGYRVGNRLRILAVSSFAVLAVSTVNPGMAFAGTDLADGICNSAEVCAYRNYSLTSNIADFNSCEPNWGCGIGDFANWDYWTANTTSFNNRSSSLWHRLSTRYAKWGNTPFSGDSICSFPGMLSNNLGSYSDTWSSMWTEDSNLCLL